MSDSGHDAATKVGGMRVAEKSHVPLQVGDKGDHGSHMNPAEKDKLEGKNPNDNKVNPSTFNPAPNPERQAGHQRVEMHRPGGGQAQI